PVAGFNLPVRAEIFGNSGVAIIRISDPTGILHPSGEIVGTLNFFDGTVDLPAARMLDSEPIKGERAQVLSDFSGSIFEVSDDGATVTLELRQAFLGILPDGRAPRARWVIGLSNTGLPSGSNPPFPSEPETL